MLILAIETTGPLASCALSDGIHTEQIINHTEYSHLEEIVPMVKTLLKEQSVKPEELDAIAVSRGPGSFTGIRIGVATAKGLAQVWNKPIITVPTLESFAYGKEQGDVVIAPLFDARRSQVYAGAYTTAVNKAKTLVPGAAYGIDEFLEKLAKAAKKKTVVFYGDGCEPYREALENYPGAHRFAEEECRFQLAENVVQLAQLMFEKGELTDCFGAEPEYMRLAEAERKLKEK